MQPFVGRTAVGLYGPGVDQLTAGISGVDLATVIADVAASTSSSSPLSAVRLVVNIGRLGRVAGGGIELNLLEPRSVIRQKEGSQLC